MSKYILKRLLGIIPVLLGITIISFALIHLAPGKPTTLDQAMNPKVSPEIRLRMVKLYGLDKPLVVQYLDWVKRLCVLDLGQSFGDNRPVLDKILERIPLTVTINVCSLIFVFLYIF